MYLVFEVFQDAWCSNKEKPSVFWHATLSCPLMASNYANSYLVPISFWSCSGCWPCLGSLPYLVLQACISFCRVSDKVGASLCFCLSEDFSLLVTFLLVTFSWLFRYFFVAFPWLFRGPHLLGKTVFGHFSWFFRGFFVAFSLLFRGFFVAFSLLFRGPNLGKFYAYSP